MTKMYEMDQLKSINYNLTKCFVILKEILKNKKDSYRVK